METKHTPGPWEVNAISMGTIESADGTAVGQAFQVRPMREDMKQTERQANASLMAAAPELFALLQTAVSDGHTITWQKKRREVLAKATGAAAKPEAT